MFRLMFPLAEQEPQLVLLSLRVIFLYSGDPSGAVNPCCRASSRVRLLRVMVASFLSCINAIGSSGSETGVRKAVW